MSLKIENLNKSFNSLEIFNNFDLAIGEHEISCIFGASGIGKTTLLNIISGVEMPDSGSVDDFKDKKFSYIFQEPRLLDWKTVRGNIGFVLKDIHTRKETSDLSDYYIDLVGLSQFGQYYPDKISGGMKQRVSIARAFAYPSDILIMDEPFKSIDLKLKNNLMISFLKLWSRDKRTIIFVTHDIEEAALLGDNIFIFEDRHPTFVKRKIKISQTQDERLRNDKIINKIKKTLSEA